MADSGSGIMFASMGLSSIGAIAQSFEEANTLRAQSDYQAGISRTNAAIADLEGKQALETGDIEASRENLKTRATIGAVRAAQGGSGTDVNSGSNALVQAAINGAGRTDELTIRNNAMRRAWGYQTEAIQDTYAGQFAQLTARAKEAQGFLTGGMQAIEGPLAIESNYLRWSRYMGGGSGGGAPFPDGK